MTISGLSDNFCAPLCLVTKGTKEEIIDRILDFLMCPTDSGQVSPPVTIVTCNHSNIMDIVYIVNCHTTLYGKYLVGEKWQIWRIMSYSPILSNIHRHTEMYLAYALTSLFAKFFLANSFYLYGLPHQIFPMYGMLCYS